MSSEGTGQLLQVPGESDVEATREPRKKPRFSYTREFLLSLSELDVCKKLPAGFDSSVLSEFEDAANSVLDWQRSSNRVEGAGGYSRGSHGRWDTRSTGSSDREGEAQNDRESFSQDSGRRYVNQYRRSWQKPEHDGLLGSGAFPRLSGYQGWTSAPKGRGNDNYQLNRSSEPYQPPRPYKATPYSRKDNTDSYNDETFGFSECSSQDRAEEERKRRASFELMRKEQQKALQEKQKHILDKHKENFNNDIIALLENSELSKSNDKLEENATQLVSQGDLGKFSLQALAPASRPLVPPGFASTTMEKNIGTQFLSINLGPAIGNAGVSDNTLLTKGALVVNGDESNPNNGNSSGLHTHSDKSEPSSITSSFVDAVEPPLASLEYSDTSADQSNCENTSYETSSLLAKGGWENDVINYSNSKRSMKNEATDTSGQSHPSSILDKLFGNALTKSDDVPKTVEGVEIDEKSWSPTSSQSSKFASWFAEDVSTDKRPAEDIPSNDLLSLIVSKNNAGSSISAVVSHEHIDPSLSSENSEADKKFKASTTTPPIDGIPELYYHGDKPITSSAVLTCEDLEQSILAEVKESSSGLPDYVQGSWRTSDANIEPQMADVDDHASQHLLSLLHKGIHSRDFTSSSNIELMLSSGRHDGMDTKSDAIVSFAGNTSPDNTEAVNNEGGKSLTLEALFGSAFMKELHSMEAPISQQRGSDVDCVDTSVPRPPAKPLPFSDNRFSSGEYDLKIGHNENMNHAHGAGLQKLEESWVGFDLFQTKRSKPAADVGHGEESLEIRLPEEESLITVGDPVDPVMCEYIPVGNTSNAGKLLGSRTNEILVDKLASLSVLQNNERSSSSVLGASTHGPYNMVEPEPSYQHLHRQPSSQIPYSRMDHMRSHFQQLDNPVHKNAQMKFIGPENAHHDHPQHPFLANIIHQHPFHNPGGPRLDPTFHLSMAQPMQMPGNLTPQHLQFFPRGVPLSHTLNPMPDYMPEAVHNFQRQPNYGGYGMGMPGINVPGGNHPQPLGGLMELNANSQQTHFSGAGRIPGIHGPELDMGFRYNR